jgi:hypothetical protein
MVLKVPDDALVQWLVNRRRIWWQKDDFNIRRWRRIIKRSEMRAEVIE